MEDLTRFEKMRQWVVELLARCSLKELHYHSVQHTLDVAAAAVRNAGLERIEGEERQLLLAAALFHDTGFTQAYRDNEPLAVEVARQALPGFGFTPPQVAHIGELILATRMPQRPATRLAMILCDADLDYLGRGDYLELSGRLRREWAAYGARPGEREWLEGQVRFLEGHRYFLESVRALRDPGKRQNLERIREALGRLPENELS
jgi:predicted metal-dependent HD superfamily phosphohydrolase